MYPRSHHQKVANFILSKSGYHPLRVLPLCLPPLVSMPLPRFATLCNDSFMCLLSVSVSEREPSQGMGPALYPQNLDQ